MEGFPDSFAQYKQNFFQFGNHLTDQLTILGSIFFGFITRHALTCAADGETLIVEQRASPSFGTSFSG